MVVSGNILASAHGGVGFLQPRGRVSSPSSFSSILQHLKVLRLRVRVCFFALELSHLLVASCSIYNNNNWNLYSAFFVPNMIKCALQIDKVIKK